jgi:hypothetical protein
MKTTPKKDYNNGKRSVNELLLLEAIDTIKANRHRLSLDEEEMIKSLAKRVDL